ncbi:cytochrome c oxidase subunit NDUFA4-like [Halichondria panicea]|uniref:cytochrome c oxidase subunit NDUFA4-like n=1 Tax=Halichondria panicea TaxID=6063 RepID=UPI00312BB6B6
MAGRILRMVKEHPDVAPVFVITILGAAFAGAAIARASIFYTDVSWDRKNNQHPWLNVKHNEQTKFIKANDYTQLKDTRPKI